jgi:ubiquinol-cytochrome c reductase iron-sulfur subunit
VRRTDVGRAVRRIGVAFGLSTLASVGLTVLYLLGGQPQLEGALIGVSLGGIGIGFVLWGKYLMPQGPFVEEREPMEPPPVERAEVEEDLVRSGATMPRRAFLTRMLLAALGALGAAAVLPIRSLGPKPGGSLFHTAWRPGARLVDSEGVPVRAGDLVRGGVLTVYPEGHTDKADAQTILLRLDPSRVRPIPGREDWSPEGHLAYSKLCTHAGCPVGLYEQTTNRLFCPCHQSVFDAADAARPVSGPATRALPQLPIEVNDLGYLVAGGDFSDPVGPSFWNGP